MQIPLLRQLAGAKDVRADLFSCLQPSWNSGIPDLPVAAADASLGEIICSGDAGRLMILILNTGANPLTSFHLGAVPTDDAQVGAGNVYPDLITAAQFHAGTQVPGLLVGQNTDPTALASGAIALLSVNAGGAYAVQLRGASTLGTTVRVWAAASKAS